MPKTSRSGSASEPKPDDLTYEEALKKLEELVEAMESGELPLESLLSRFEEGTRLARLCQAKLAEAESRIQKLEQDAEGGLELKPFDTGAAENP